MAHLCCNTLRDLVDGRIPQWYNIETRSVTWHRPNSKCIITWTNFEYFSNTIKGIQSKFIIKLAITWFSPYLKIGLVLPWNALELIQFYLPQCSLKGRFIVFWSDILCLLSGVLLISLISTVLLAMSTRHLWMPLLSNKMINNRHVSRKRIIFQLLWSITVWIIVRGCVKLLY